jgi:hypothetical protein
MDSESKPNTRPDTINLDIPPQQPLSEVLEDIKHATKGDGALRRVSVNDSFVPEEYVLHAMFSNQDFMPVTDQFPLPVNGFEFVESREVQRMMFAAPYKQGGS